MTIPSCLLFLFCLLFLLCLLTMFPVVVMVYEDEARVAKPVAYLTRGMAFGVGHRLALNSS